MRQRNISAGHGVFIQGKVRMDKPLFNICWSLACEATQHSVQDPVLGERGVLGFKEILDRYGIKGTFLPIAGDIESRPSLYRSLHEEGHQIGIHVHPADEGYVEFAGLMGPDEQREMFAKANDRWAQVMGFHPETLAIGYGSANDYTYSALEEAGFDHGNISLVGRRLPECACVWEGTPPYIHYANRYNRLLPGDMDFIEIPHTVDIESRMWGGKHAQDYRAELVDAKNHWYTAFKTVKHQKDNDAVPVKIIRGTTHNTFDLLDPNDFRRKTLIGMIEGLKDILESEECESRWVPWKPVADEYRRTVQKVDIKKVLTLDRRGYRGKKTV